MGELGELDGEESLLPETFCPPFTPHPIEFKLPIDVFLDSFFFSVACYCLTLAAYIPCASPHLQGSWRGKLGHRRLPNARVNHCPHQMPVQQDIHLRRVSAAS